MNCPLHNPEGGWSQVLKIHGAALVVAFALTLALPICAAEPAKSGFAVPVAAAFFNLLDLTRPELAAVRQAVEARDWSAAKQAWAQHLATRTAPRWFWLRQDRPAFAQIYDAHFGGLAHYTNAADRVLARDFNFLGVRKQLAPQVEWLQGPIEWTHMLSRFGSRAIPPTRGILLNS
jgi:hypothetical protein